MLVFPGVQNERLFPILIENGADGFSSFFPSSLADDLGYCSHRVVLYSLEVVNDFPVFKPKDGKILESMQISLGLTSEPIPYMFEERTTNNGHDVLAKVYLYGNTREGVMVPC